MPEKSIELALGEDRDDIPELIKVSFEDVNDDQLKREAQKENNKLVKKQNLLSVKYIDAQLTPLVTQNQNHLLITLQLWAASRWNRGALI